jgi:hypothetical protein
VLTAWVAGVGEIGRVAGPWLIDDRGIEAVRDQSPLSTLSQLEQSRPAGE